ncbi:uncharacterized protein [Leptinotarsa decemlineata]|uniref:uncharacterized protein n=1 Tax=Leptinotarsa decemlineata TaxID=7539 RepID=UPI003D304A1E
MSVTRNKQEINSLIKESIQGIFQDRDFISGIVKKVTDKIERKLKKLEEELKTQAERTSHLQQKVDKKEKTNYLLEQKVDDIYQNMKATHVCVYGVNEDADEEENLRDKIKSIINTNTGLNLGNDNIVGCYRIGRKMDKPNKSRPIILKLVNTELKSKMFKDAYKFKGKKIFIAEDLTKKPRIILKEAQNVFGMRNAWSFKGSIYIKHEGRNVKMNFVADITQYTTQLT